MAEEKKKKEWNATGAFDCLAVTSVQVYPFKEGPSMGHIKGLASVVLNDQFLVRGLRVMEGENGYLVPKQNPKALADAMLRMMQLSKEEREAFGTASKRLVEEEFSMEQVMKKWYLLYRGEKQE